jgi:hypothetical protein
VVSADASPTFSGSGETDWYYQEQAVSGDAEGRTNCNDALVGTYRCDQHYITIEPGHWNQGLICHETGHAAGLTHGNMAYPVVGMQATVLGCMRKETSAGMTLGNNQEVQINANY